MRNTTKKFAALAERKLDQAEAVYGKRQYSIAYDGSINDAIKLRKLGYKATKTRNVKNHYVISVSV
jgi:hypothetical protein